RVSEDGASAQPSLVFCRPCAAQARHLRAAAATDKEEAINPCKITSTDSLSRSNTPVRAARSSYNGACGRLRVTARRSGHWRSSTDSAA
ncbi:hypothetical protein ABG768_014783, partial [Culter alburnus]